MKLTRHERDGIFDGYGNYETNPDNPPKLKVNRFPTLYPSATNWIQWFEVLAEKNGWTPEQIKNTKKTMMDKSWEDVAGIIGKLIEWE